MPSTPIADSKAPMATDTKPDCVFCHVRDQWSSAKWVWEDDIAFAIEDIAPQAPVHLPVIPREHVSTLNEVKDGGGALVGHLFEIAARLANQRGIAESGWRAVINCNGDGHQTVFHLHLHVMGGRSLGWPPG